MLPRNKSAPAAETPGPSQVTQPQPTCIYTHASASIYVSVVVYIPYFGTNEEAQLEGKETAEEIRNITKATKDSCRISY